MLCLRWGIRFLRSRVCVNACVRVCVSVLEMTLELMFNGARRKEFRKVPPRITIHGAAHVRHRRFGNNEVIVFCVCVCVVAVGGGRRAVGDLNTYIFVPN